MTWPHKTTYNLLHRVPPEVPGQLVDETLRSLQKQGFLPQGPNPKPEDLTLPIGSLWMSDYTLLDEGTKIKASVLVQRDENGTYANVGLEKEIREMAGRHENFILIQLTIPPREVRNDGGDPE